MFSKKLRDRTMLIICKFYWQNIPGGYITTEYLYTHGFPSSENANSMLKTLESMGYVTLNAHANDPDFSIRLAPKGRCYFETNSDNRIAFLKKSVLIPILVSVITTLILTESKPLLSLLLELLRHFL
jgi:hypothetical protein